MSVHVRPGYPETIDVSNLTGPFGWLSWSNALILYLGINSFFAVIALLLSGGTVDGILFLLLSAIAFAFWSMWRNATVLAALVNPLTITASLALSVVCIGLVAAGVTEATQGLYDEYQSYETTQAAMGFLAFGLTGLAAGAAAAAIAIGRRLQVPAFAMPLGAFLKEMQPLRSGRDGLRLPARNPVLGWLALLAGAGVFLGLNLIPAEVYFASSNTVRAFGYVGAFGFVLFVAARAQFEPVAESVLGVDTRPPVLFLRSFQDDEKNAYFDSDSSLIDFSLEARLVEHFSGVGPFIAVGSPADKTPMIGAARTQLSDSDWQDAVLDWMDHAGLIVVVAGVTGWINWELSKVVERGHVERLIVVFPQLTRLNRFKDKALRKRKHNAETRLANVRQAFAGSSWGPSLARIANAQELRAIVFGPGGAVTTVTSRSDGRSAHHLSVVVAHAVLRFGAAGSQLGVPQATPKQTNQPATSKQASTRVVGPPATVTRSRPFASRPRMELIRRHGTDEWPLGMIGLGARARGAFSAIKGAAPPIDQVVYEWSDTSRLLSLIVPAGIDVRLLREGAPYPTKISSAHGETRAQVSPGDVLYVAEWIMKFHD
jgi:hypothetical protein